MLQERRQERKLTPRATSIDQKRRKCENTSRKLLSQETRNIMHYDIEPFINGAYFLLLSVQ